MANRKEEEKSLREIDNYKLYGEFLIEDRVKEYESFINLAEKIRGEIISEAETPRYIPPILFEFFRITEKLDERGFMILMERKSRSLGVNFHISKYDKENNILEFEETSLDCGYLAGMGENGEITVTIQWHSNETPSEKYWDKLWHIYENPLARGFALLIFREGFTFRKTTPEEVSGLSENVIEIRDEKRGISYGITPSEAYELIDNFGREADSRLHILLRPEELTPETAQKLANLEEMDKSRSRAVGFLADYLEEIKEMLGME